MGQITEINQGELKINFDSPREGVMSLADLGLTEQDLKTEGGKLRLVIHLENIGEHHYYSMPTIEISYAENIGTSEWHLEFNETPILDKLDYSGHATVLLVNRKKLEELEHRHINELILHADFPEDVSIDPLKSYIRLFC